jgi:hypothetical protein
LPRWHFLFHFLFIFFFSFILYLKIGRTQLDSSPLLIIHHFSGHGSAVAPTAHCQYSFLKTVPVFHFLPSQHSKQCQLSSIFLASLLLFLSGDIQINPGPTIQLSLCTLNIRSLFAENRSVFISDLLTTDNIDIFPFTETFQNATTTTPSQVFDITPKNFSFLVSRDLVTDSTLESRVLPSSVADWVSWSRTSCALTSSACHHSPPLKR